MGKALSLLALSLLMALSQISLFLSDALEKGNAGDRTESAACRIHVFAEEEMIREAGLVTEGILVRKCRNCGYSEKITIPELMQARTLHIQTAQERLLCRTGSFILRPMKEMPKNTRS